MIVLKRDLNQAKNGYLARSPELRVAAFGSTLELANRNLERLALLYLRPFERDGCLRQEVERARLTTEGDDLALEVRLAD